MANTTFTGPVRSENGFSTIVKDTTTGAITNSMTFSEYTATVTVANGELQEKKQQLVSLQTSSLWVLLLHVQLQLQMLLT